MLGEASVGSRWVTRPGAAEGSGGTQCLGASGHGCGKSRPTGVARAGPGLSGLSSLQKPVSSNSWWELRLQRERVFS